MLIYLSFACALLLVGADYGIKQLVVSQLKPIGSVPLWDGVLHLSYYQNTGAAFSILNDSTRLLIALTGAALAVIVCYMLFKKPNSRWLCASLALILGGGLGNLVDRVLLGYVIDYIDVRIIRFAVFNFADMCAVCGTIMVMAYLIFVDVIKLRMLRKEDERVAREAAQAAADTDVMLAGQDDPQPPVPAEKPVGTPPEDERHD